MSVLAVLPPLDSGDIAWVLTATALVMIMTPGLGFFYGGLVRRKNLVSTIVQTLTIFAVVSLVWALWGYSLVFAPSVNGVVGDLSKAGLANVGAAPNPTYSNTIPELLYFAFQLKFAAITPALTGAHHRRVRRAYPFQSPLGLHGSLDDIHLLSGRALGLG